LWLNVVRQRCCDVPRMSFASNIPPRVLTAQVLAQRHESLTAGSTAKMRAIVRLVAHRYRAWYTLTP
jgi:hypothetical protein